MLSIRAVRKSKGMTQLELAEKAGIPIPNLCRLERGQDDNPTLKTLKKIADALEVGVYELIDDGGGKSGSEPTLATGVRGLEVIRG